MLLATLVGDTGEQSNEKLVRIAVIFPGVQAPRVTRSKIGGLAMQKNANG